MFTNKLLFSSLAALLPYHTHLSADQANMVVPGPVIHHHSIDVCKSTFPRTYHDELEALSSCAFASSQTMPTPILTNHSISWSCHWLQNIANMGQFIEIEDGSHWIIAPYDISTLYGWRPQDCLVITPMRGWFGRTNAYEYYITNQSTGSYVQANLSIGPIAHGPYSHWIIHVDYVGRHVYLEDQSVWCIDAYDAYELREWAINDHVIFGTNNAWISSYDHILINVNRNKYVRSKMH